MKGAPFLVTMLVLAVAPPVVAGSSEPIVTVRTYNYARVAADGLANARVTADGIFKDAGVSLVWADCRVPQRDVGDRCIAPLDRGRNLILRLMEVGVGGPAPGTRILALGTSMVDHERRGGVMMTVDPLTIHAIASTVQTDVWTVLGRAIAHEIGHLLLGTAEHPTTGLMRARWSHDELSGIRPAHWRFSPGEAAQMRRGLAMKAPSAN